MTNNLPDRDLWYEEYDESSVKQRYQMLLDLVKQPLSEEYLEDLELADLLITMSDELHSNNLNSEAITLINLVKQHQPKFYKQEFSFYDKFLVEYYLYTQQDDLLAEALVNFQKYPAKDLEQFFVVLDLLVFYEKSTTVVSLCEAAYKSIHHDPDIPTDVDDELSWLIIINMLANVYQQHQQGNEVNWIKLSNALQSYGYDRDGKWLEDLKFTITQGFDREYFTNQYKQKKLHFQAFNTLSTAFCIYMQQEKQMDFVCSQKIWETIFAFLDSKDLNFKQQANPNTFFTFNRQEIEPYLAQKMRGFLSLQQAQGFAILWGIPYLYDFLLAQEIIQEQVHRKTIKIIKKLKAELLEAYENSWQLWRYDFINRWQPDHNTDTSELARQKQKFTASFNQSEPLSDIPGESKLQSFFSEMADRLGFDLDAVRERIESDEEEIEAFESPTIETTKVTPTQTKNKKGKKKKKSNLSLAAKLYGNS